jgi:hypothetical protein
MLKIGERIMERKFLILICLILFIVSVAAVSAAEADTNQTDDLELNMWSTHCWILKDWQHQLNP